MVEEMPVFQNGSPESFRAYIHKNLKYPKLAFKYKNCGKIHVSFTVTEDGSIDEVEVVGSAKEAVRVIRNSPKWRPGVAKGKPVKVRFTYPVLFALY